MKSLSFTPLPANFHSSCYKEPTYPTVLPYLSEFMIIFFENMNEWKSVGEKEEMNEWTFFWT